MMRVKLCHQFLREQKQFKVYSKLTLVMSYVFAWYVLKKSYWNFEQQMIRLSSTSATGKNRLGKNANKYSFVPSVALLSKRFNTRNVLMRGLRSWKRSEFCCVTWTNFFVLVHNILFGITPEILCNICHFMSILGWCLKFSQVLNLKEMKQNLFNCAWNYPNTHLIKD